MVDQTTQYSNPWLQLYQETRSGQIRATSTNDDLQTILPYDIPWHIRTHNIKSVLKIIESTDMIHVKDIAEEIQLDIIVVDQVCVMLQKCGFVYQRAKGHYQTTEEGELYIQNRWDH